LALLALASLVVQLLGVTVDFNQYLLQLYERGVDSAETIFRADLSPHLGHWGLLRDGVWDLAWAQNIARGVDWHRLLWPLGLLVVVLAGWFAAGRLGSLGRKGSALVGVVALVLLGTSMVSVARLPEPADDWQAGSQQLSASMEATARPGDVMILDLLAYSSHLDLATSFQDRYKAAPGYWGWARQEPVSRERQTLLANMNQEYQRLWLTLDTTPEADPASTTERWLDENAYRVESRWLSPSMRLVRYELAGGRSGEAPEKRLDLRFGDQMWLMDFGPGPPEARAGEVWPFSLLWQAEGVVSEDYVVFVQLLDADGGLRAQLDRQPVGGFRPTSTWQPGELVRDNYGLQLPADLPSGDYRLIAGLYLPATMERASITSAEGLYLGDFAALSHIEVLSGNQSGALEEGHP
jgi:hypothetical protein